MAEKFCHSTNEDQFDSEEYDSREEAIAACIHENDLSEGDKVWTGTRCDPVPDEFMPRASQIIELLQMAADDEGGEFAEGWLTGISSEDEEELESRVADAIKEWIKARNLEPSWFLVRNVEEHEVTEAEAQATA